MHTHETDHWPQPGWLTRFHSLAGKLLDTLHCGAFSLNIVATVIHASGTELTRSRLLGTTVPVAMDCILRATECARNDDAKLTAG